MISLLINSKLTDLRPSLYLEIPSSLSHTRSYSQVSLTFKGRDTGHAHQQESQPPTIMPWWNSIPARRASLDKWWQRWQAGDRVPWEGILAAGRTCCVPCPPLPATQEHSSASLCSHMLLTHSVTSGSGLFIISDCNFLFSQTPTLIPWHFCSAVTFCQLFISPSHTDRLFCWILGPSQSWCVMLTERFRVTSPHCPYHWFPVKCATSPHQLSPKALTAYAPISG